MATPDRAPDPVAEMLTRVPPIGLRPLRSNQALCNLSMTRAGERSVQRLEGR